MARSIISVKSRDGWDFFEDVPIRSKLPESGKSLWCGSFCTDEVKAVELVNLEDRGLVANGSTDGLEFYEITYHALNLTFDAKKLFALNKGVTK